MLIREPFQKVLSCGAVVCPRGRGGCYPQAAFPIAIADNTGPHSRRTIWICFLQINPPRLLEALLLSPSDSGSFTAWRISQDTPPSTNSHIRMLTSPVGASNLEGSRKPRGGTVSPRLGLLSWKGLHLVRPPPQSQRLLYCVPLLECLYLP